MDSDVSTIDSSADDHVLFDRTKLRHLLAQLLRYELSRAYLIKNKIIWVLKEKENNDHTMPP